MNPDLLCGPEVCYKSLENEDQGTQQPCHVDIVFNYVNDVVTPGYS